MGEIHKQALINAPADTIFRYVADPHNAPSYINSIGQIISGPQGPLAEGQTWRAEATLMGRRSIIDLCLRRLDPPRGVAFSIDGDPAGLLSIRMAPNGGQPGTRVSLTLDVPKVPSLFLGAIMGSLLEADLSRLKAKLES